MKADWYNQKLIVAFRNYGWPGPAWKVDPWVAGVADMGAEVVIVDGHAQTAVNYTTAVSIKNAHLGRHDMVVELVDACHRRGLKFVAYIPALNLLPYLAQHPDDVCVDKDRETSA